MKATPQEIRRLLKNKNTELLVNWVGEQKEITKKLHAKMLHAPIFFHPTHNKKDRELIIYLLEDILKCKIDRLGESGVLIKF